MAADLFADRMGVGGVYADAEPVAVGCGFVFQDEFEMTWGASLP